MNLLHSAVEGQSRLLYVNLYKTPNGIVTGPSAFEEEAEALGVGREVAWGDFLGTVGVPIDAPVAEA